VLLNDLRQLLNGIIVFFINDDEENLLHNPTKFLELIQNIRSQHLIFTKTQLKHLYEK